jgi:hypothetical protein
MPSIYPDVAAGGLEVRDGSGNPTNPANVQNAYVPAPAYVTSCPITALPSDCTARIEPKQINAIASELYSFAECLDPDGPWDCYSLKNICTSFNTWAAINVPIIYISDTPPATPKQNQLWWESDSGVLYVWYDDGNSIQWVQVIGTGPGGASALMDGVSIVGLGSAADPYAVGLIDCGTY